MQQRGRKSAAQLSVAQLVEIVPRPTAPDHLTDAQAEVWDRVVGRMPGDHFTDENLDLLAQYCRHVVEARRIADMVAGMAGDPDTSLEDYDRLLKMQEREGRAMSSLATRMRLTQQTRQDRRTQAKTSKRPWEG